jgi:hypothetical protein
LWFVGGYWKEEEFDGGSEGGEDGDDVSPRDHIEDESGERE